MFSFLQSKTHNELEKIILRLKMNAENNYRDATREDLEELESTYRSLHDAGKLNRKQIAYYSDIIEVYKEKLKNFSHRSQKVSSYSEKI